MRKTWLFQFVFAGFCAGAALALPTPDFLQAHKISYTDNAVINDILSFDELHYESSPLTSRFQQMVKQMLKVQGISLNRGVINKVLLSLQCADHYHVAHNNILTIIDYSLPSNEKRLWVFDLAQLKLLYHTYVSHGINSGTLLTDNFSNKNNSKASSIGVYRTQESYHGREGLTLKLEGLDHGFNDQSWNRAIVMHGGWYVNEDFIKKYGRPGRSWGCPALPLDLSSKIINTIKNSAWLVSYYPSDAWLSKSKFLACNQDSPSGLGSVNETVTKNRESEQRSQRDAILFADLNNNHQREENEPVVVISALLYQQIFHHTPPLNRMLRRQINQMEYIALIPAELESLMVQHQQAMIYFVVPEVAQVRGYYMTQMKILPWGEIKSVSLKTPPVDKPSSSVPTLSHQSSSNAADSVYHVDSQVKSGMILRTSNYFIRWLGL